MAKRRWLGPTVAVALAVALALTGCGGDDPTDTDDDIYYRYEDRDEFMEAFEGIYEAMYLSGLDDLLHPSFRLVPNAATIETWGWASGTTLDREEFLGIHENLFGGESGTDAADVELKPIASIVIDKLVQKTEWAAIPADDDVFGGVDGWMATFTFQTAYYNPDLYHYYLVGEPLQFYVKLRAYDDDEFWQIVGIRCADASAVQGTRAYADLLACYW